LLRGSKLSRVWLREAIFIVSRMEVDQAGWKDRPDTPPTSCRRSCQAGSSGQNYTTGYNRAIDRVTCSGTKPVPPISLRNGAWFGRHGDFARDLRAVEQDLHGQLNTGEIPGVQFILHYFC
jgi:hypothetical protein